MTLLVIMTTAKSRIAYPLDAIESVEQAGATIVVTTVGGGRKVYHAEGPISFEDSHDDCLSAEEATVAAEFAQALDGVTPIGHGLKKNTNNKLDFLVIVSSTQCVGIRFDSIESVETDSRSMIVTTKRGAVTTHYHPRFIGWGAYPPFARWIKGCRWREDYLDYEAVNAAGIEEGLENEAATEAWIEEALENEAANAELERKYAVSQEAAS